MRRLFNSTLSHSLITQMETLLAWEWASWRTCRGTCSSCVQTGCSELTSWSATTSTLGRPLWPGSCKLGQGSSWAPTYRGPIQGLSSSSSNTSCHTGHQGPTQRRLSLTQRRAVNQAAPRRELGGGPPAGPKQRNTYICKRFQRHYYFERMIEWSW